MKGTVTHFEIYGEEPAKLAEFYRVVLGWQLDKAPGVDYWRIQTDSLNGGLSHRPLAALRNWLNYVNVDSLDATLAQAVKMGAEVLREKTALPKTAWYAIVADPAGNAFGLWQSDPNAFPPPEPNE
jgi:predicted enzyme related to lactoylglutathione lyase